MNMQYNDGYYVIEWYKIGYDIKDNMIEWDIWWYGIGDYIMWL